MRTPFEQVRYLVDALGESMSPDDWIAFLADVEDDVHDKRVVAESEQEND